MPDWPLLVNWFYVKGRPNWFTWRVSEPSVELTRKKESLMKVDVHSKGEIAAFLDKWEKAGAVKKCMNLRLDAFPDGHYSVICTKDWASRVQGNNVEYVHWDGTRLAYKWPKCPDNCPHFTESTEFLKTATRDQYDEQNQRRAIAIEATKTPKPQELLPPPKYTAYWVFKHGHISVWLWLGSLLLGSLGVGFAAGRWTAQYEHAAIPSQQAVPTATSNASAAKARTSTPASATKK